MGDLTEVAIPTRFVFLLLAPSDTIDDREIWHASEMARSLAVLFSDKVSGHIAIMPGFQPYVSVHPYPFP